MKKNHFLTISLIFIFLSTIVVGQVKIQYENSFSPSSISIARAQVKVGSKVKSTNYGQITGSEIGMEVINDSTKNVYRTYYKFNLFEIHDNATIKEVKVIYTTNSTGHSFKITQINKLGSTNSNNWTVIGTSGNIKTGLVYSGFDEEFISPILKTKIKGLLSKDEIILGGLSEKETTDGSESDLSLSLYIKWERPGETYTVTVKNDMDGWSGGFVGVGTSSPASRQSPHTFPATETLTYKLKAFDNQHNDVDGYNYVYNDTEAPLEKSEWKKQMGTSIPVHKGYSVNQTFLAQSNVNNASYIAYLKKVCNLTFTNSFNGISETGSIKVDGSTVSAPTAAYPVIEGNIIRVEALEYVDTDNDVTYEFSHWSDNNSTQNPRTITASENANITAVFIGRAIFVDYGINNRNMQFNIQGNEKYNTIYWNEHKNPNITKYNVWRSTHDENDNIVHKKIKTVGRGTTKYLDYDYKKAAPKSKGSTLLGYSVKAYFAPDGTESLSNYKTIWGEQEINKFVGADSLNVELSTSKEIKEFSLNSNYPNPFNPTTQISYQIPENSFVSLVVYNALGQEVTQLVNQHQSSGRYTVQFNAANLPSGVYIYKLQAGDFINTKKMLLTK